MVKYICDSCKSDKRKLYTLPIFKHIFNENAFSGHGTTVVDPDGTTKLEPISGIRIDIDLCIVCYNKVMYKSYNEIIKPILSDEKIKEIETNNGGRI